MDKVFVKDEDFKLIKDKFFTFYQCPKCGHCGNIPTTNRWWEYIFIPLIFIFALWFSNTLWYWVLKDQYTLIQILENQWKWIISLIERIT